MVNVVELGLQSVTMAAPLILIAMAGYASERSGVVNIALEGKTLIAAFLCWAFAPKLGMAGGVAVAVFGASVMSLLHWLLTQTYRMDQVISGMAINLLAGGFTSFLKFKFGNDAMPDNTIFPLNVYYCIAILSPVLMWFVAKHTRFGLRHRSVGSDPDKARLLGINPQQIRFSSLILTGVFCGIAGALLVSNVAIFTDQMTSGRGYIALAALILGGWRPIPAALSCLLFGFATALQLQFNGTGGVPTEFWKMLPYVVTLLALAGFLGKNRTPFGLGKH
jgi:general nucleoside transport system permease protein